MLIVFRQLSETQLFSWNFNIMDSTNFYFSISYFFEFSNLQIKFKKYSHPLDLYLFISFLFISSFLVLVLIRLKNLLTIMLCQFLFSGILAFITWIFFENIISLCNLIWYILLFLRYIHFYQFSILFTLRLSFLKLFFIATI